MKTHIYTCCKSRAIAKDDDVPLLRKDICNAGDHWAGDHSMCAQLDPTKKCVLEKRGADKAYYVANGETHVAVKAWLEEKCTLAKLKHYTHAKEFYLSETFHSVINKYAPKRIHFAKRHKARIAAAALVWTEGMDREVLARKQRVAAGTTVRKRSARRKILSEKTHSWKKEVYCMQSYFECDVYSLSFQLMFQCLSS